MTSSYVLDSAPLYTPPRSRRLSSAAACSPTSENETAENGVLQNVLATKDHLSPTDLPDFVANLIFTPSSSWTKPFWSSSAYCW